MLSKGDVLLTGETGLLVSLGQKFQLKPETEVCPDTSLPGAYQV